MEKDAVSQVKKYLIQLQNQLCQVFSEEDGKATFLSDIWSRPQGGGGDTRIIENGRVFEKGGVNFSHIYGNALPSKALVQHDLSDHHFEALGVSVVMHPHNPYVPTAHLNVRFFCATKENAKMKWWFGGGFDMTPYYGFKEDCIHWHTMAKTACDPFGKDVYTQYKKTCDEYFFLPHRNEPRGIGGLFFDELNHWGFDQCFAFMQSVGVHFIKAYQPIVAKRKSTQYGDREKAFQKYRRGRYVEFNLLYDRGTLFGLQSGGRTESILMSLPPNVIWQYNWQPQPNSVEEQLYKEFLVAKDWIKIT